MIDFHDLMKKRMVENFRIAFIRDTNMSLSFSDMNHKEYNTYYSGNKCEFCRLINSDPEGIKKCMRCSRQAAHRAARLPGPMIYRCYAGLVEIVVPVIIGGKHIANVYTGQVLDEEPDEKQYVKVVRALRKMAVPEQALRQAYLNIPIIPAWRVDVIKSMLALMVEYIVESEMNALLEEEVKKEKQKSKDLNMYVRNECADSIVNDRAEQLSGLWDKLRFIGFKKNPDTLMICKLDQYEQDICRRDVQQRVLINEKVLSALQAVVPEAENALTHSLGEGNYLLVFSLGCGRAENIHYHESHKFANALRKEVQARTGYTVSVGMAGIVERLERIGAAYREAARTAAWLAMRSQQEQSAHISDLLAQENVEVHPQFDSARLAAYISAGSRQTLLRFIVQLRQEMRPVGRSLADLKALYSEILRVALATADAQEVSNWQGGERVSWLAELISVRSAQKADAVLTGYLDTVMKKIAEAKAMDRNQTIAAAKKYIATHYREPITIGKIASAAYVTPNYLSFLFRRHTGMSCVEYITRLRIEHIKRRLETSDQSVADISREAGFRSANYMSVVFRKMEKVSPTDFRGRFSADRQYSARMEAEAE